MKNICKSTSYNLLFCLILTAFLIYGCSKQETPEVAVVSEEAKPEAKVEQPLAPKLPNLGADAEAYYKYGIGAIKDGNFGMAVQAWERATEIDPTMTDRKSVV